MSLAGEILAQTARNIWSHKLRSVLTMFGISWGIASIVFMVAIGEGFKVGYRNMMYSLGTDITILWPGKTSRQAGGSALEGTFALASKTSRPFERTVPW